jgi:SPP1 family phage portal protein
MGAPVVYSGKDNKDITSLTDALEKADASTQDADLALDVSVFGRGFELVYMSSGEKSEPKLARVSPLNAFVVYDDTVEQKPVFGVYYFPVFDEKGQQTGYAGQYSTAQYITNIKLDTLYKLTGSEAPEAHYFGDVPLIEYYNNSGRKGDFEPVISLIDAYNTLQSDRINDKEQFVDAILLIKGQVLGDSSEEEKEAYESIRKNKVMMLDMDGDASFLTRQFDESSLDVLRQAVVSDIHKISCVPDLTDESFSGNSSGVAIKYKLLGLEQLTKTKERYFVEGLKIRLQLISNILGIKGSAKVDVSDIEITFNRSLPANALEEAQIASTLSGIVPQRTLLSNLSMVKDPDAALEELEEEKAQAVERQQVIAANTPILEDETE